MKIQKYIVTIEMPDGDTISPSWLKDLIQADCDVEECDRQKVSVKELSKPELPSNLDEAAEKYAKGEGLENALGGWEDMFDAFKAGVELMAGQFQKIEGELVDWYSTSDGKDYCCGVKTEDSFEVPEGFYIKKK